MLLTSELLLSGSLPWALGDLVFSFTATSPLSGLPQWLSSEESACQCRRYGFDPWVGKIPWRRTWQPTPVCLPGEFRGQRSLEDCSLLGQRVRHDWVTFTSFYAPRRDWLRGQCDCSLDLSPSQKADQWHTRIMIQSILLLPGQSLHKLMFLALLIKNQLQSIQSF